MDSEEFRIRGKEMVDFIADYLENVSQRRVTPNVEPGYLKSLINLEPPSDPENWDTIIKDVEEKIMPGITHWQHPRFHAYFPAGNSFPSILGDMLSSGLGIIGFSWASSPACTELETIIMHWLGKMSGLNKKLLPFTEEEHLIENLFDDNMNSSFTTNRQLNKKDSLNATEANLDNNEDTATNQTLLNGLNHSVHWGGGVLLGSASECVLVSMLAARGKAIAKYKRKFGFEEDGVILTKLVAYGSKLSHCCVEKAAMISLVKIRLLDFDEEYSLRGETLKKAIDDDIENGLIPFYVCGTFGTTGCCSYDNIVEIGPICQAYQIYLHVDAAYAGNALICEEFRDLMQGTEYLDSFSYNPNKWMLVNFDCSCLWVKDKHTLIKALTVDPVYLQYRKMEKAIDYRHWGIALSRRFRSLKLWFTIRSYGVKGLQEYIRHHVKLAKEFEKLVLTDNRFEIFGKVTLGLVCFRLKGPDVLSKNLLFILNDNGEIHMTPAVINDKYVLRFCVNSKKASTEDIEIAWNIIKSAAEKTLQDYKTKFQIMSPELNELDPDYVISLAKLKRKTFVRMVSDPVGFRSARSFSLRSFSIEHHSSRPHRLRDEKLVETSETIEMVNEN